MSPLAAQLPPSSAAAPRPAWPDTAWRQIGPALFGGRVDDIEAVADDPRIIFVGAASGGVFRSLNNGVTWEPVFDAFGTALSVGAIAIAPSDPHTVWVGTGEANNRQTSTWGDGVYRSLDGGTTWQHRGLGDTQSIGRVVIDPHDPRTVFVAAVGHLWGPNDERGLYRTKDGGATWQRVLGVDANTGVIDVALGADGHTLFAATYERRRRAFGFVGGGPESGIWRSLDAGDTWVRVSQGLPTGNTGRIGLAIARSDPRIVYAVIEHHEGGVFRSSDGGATWTRQNRLNERGTYYGQIRVDPVNPDRVWLLLTTLYLSIDGGKTFTGDSLAVRVHADNHALWIDPRQPEHMILGNDGGVFVTYDGARDWDAVNNLPIGQFYDIAIDGRDPYWIYGGLQDQGTFMFPSGTHSRGTLTDEGVTFLGYGDGFQVAVDPIDPRLVYTNSQNGRGYLVDLVSREERRFTPVPVDSTERYRFNWNTATLLSPNDPHTYYYGANKLLKTMDRGTTWQVMSPDLTRNDPDWKKRSLGNAIPLRDSTMPSLDDGVGLYGNITTISESPRAAGTLYVGTDDGNVQLSTDGGAHWSNITSRLHLPAPRWVSSVLASRFDPKTAYVTMDGHRDDDFAPYVFKTTDDGVRWSSIAGDLPAGIVVRTLTEDPRNPLLLFAGTEFGLYWSFDGGRHWRFPGGALPRVMVDRILVDGRTDDLILGTYGRGVIILDDISALETRDPALAAEPVQLFALRDATAFYQWRDQPVLGTRQWAAPNAPLGVLVTYALAGPAPSTRGGEQGDSTTGVRIRVSAADGAVVRELAGPATNGLHRVRWDLRTQFPFTPAAPDSGYYGAPRAPYVRPGDYTVTLSARGTTVTQTVRVRADSQALGGPEALAARHEMMTAIDSLSRAFRDGKRAYAALDTQLTLVKALAKDRPLDARTDSLLRHVGEQLAALRPGFAEAYGTPIGAAFDLLGGLESSSLTPTEAERRTLAVVRGELRTTLTRLNDLITGDVAKLRDAVAQEPPVPAVRPVTLP
ncbi:MAG TPA: hypothetical protein VGV12_00260 [Gemmatimonadales bacterium]|nr:hypothetical protein [Gemmatimonadales bacterium]